LLVWLLLSTLIDPMRRLPPHRLVPIAALMLALVVAPTFAGAAGSGGDRKQQLQEQIGEASRAEAAALADLQDIRNRRAVIDARVAELDAQQAAAQAKLAPLEAEAARLAAEYAALQAQVVATQARLDKAQRTLDRTAAGLYRTERRGASYDVVFAARPDQVVSQSAYLDRVSEQRHRIVERVTVLRNDLEDQRKQLEAQKAKADATAAEARAIRDQIAAVRAEIEPARVEAAQEQFLEQQAIENIQQSKAQYEAELAAMSVTSDSIGARLRARGGSGGSAPCQARPVPGAIVSGFGMRYHPILHYSRMHTGVDMHASAGTPIHACRGGVVIIAGSQGGYGNAVVIDHGGGMGTLYAHQSRIAVHEGQTVSAGQTIGFVGSTGLATGPHLHFEVRLSGNPVDPAPYL
jgi:murein DD-endopeptidase MepM/ murein hydrolase activator NlpD